MHSQYFEQAQHASQSSRTLSGPIRTHMSVLLKVWSAVEQWGLFGSTWSMLFRVHSLNHLPVAKLSAID